MEKRWRFPLRQTRHNPNRVGVDLLLSRSILSELFVSPERLPPLYQMLMESECEERQSAQQRPPVVDLKNMAVRFLLERVVAWLSEEGRSQSDHLVDMIFSSLHCCSPQETTRILNHITMVKHVFLVPS